MKIISGYANVCEYDVIQIPKVYDLCRYGALHNTHLKKDGPNGSSKLLRGFPGLTGYNRWFVRNYGILVRPLTALTKKDGFQWTETEATAFERLKQALISAPVLRLTDFSVPFLIECDASSEGVGTILIQDDHPVAYFRKGFAPSTRFKSAYDRELLALVLAVQKWNNYLLGRHFFIRTDHFTLKYLLEQRFTTFDQQSSIDRDPYTKDIMSSLATDPASVPDYADVGQSLLYKGRLVVSDYLNLHSHLGGFMYGFIAGLPPSYRVDTILVVVDRLSKYAHFLPLSHPFTAKTVANIFCKEIV
ncbi:hypothetical protein E3N88_45437 [Mikania micrantha]|uniref:Reverse transcriptase/retrotransposon-derived protein RNase H-like domain-containing protein n=1 Tax=Mikania micrantha TaxID=192012 RepID=A0A5N6L9T9_9ASTR|nr:hypothetical protein E3N88_45437 [Mikania micrantha]